ncbi:uncharacterized protein METZ01_LOCUS127495 [marine metagenome]|uniref:Uncharacterized protein n=1 Tax=marine metagenome TaxID=408172 RepID=A0A381YDI1_9ZZZZ
MGQTHSLGYDRIQANDPKYVYYYLLESGALCE